MFFSNYLLCKLLQHPLCVHSCDSPALHWYIQVASSLLHYTGRYLAKLVRCLVHNQHSIYWWHLRVQKSIMKILVEILFAILSISSN